jgi:hypothetical protein
MSNWRGVCDEIQYYYGGFLFLAGAVGWLFGMSQERAVYVMVSGLGFSVLAYMRMQRDRGQQG